MKRLFDFVCAFIGLAVFLLPGAVIASVIKITSRGPVFYLQQRTGLQGKVFTICKFRTMVDKADILGSSVTTGSDPRITAAGRFLRRTKLDELPQLWNVLTGDMSLVGPRPDVPEITRSYTPAMREIFTVRPGITSVATLHFRNEEAILAKVPDPDRFYAEVVLPLKVELAMEHVRRRSFLFDLEVLCLTVWMLTPLGKIWPICEPAPVRQFRVRYAL